jgi:hypothetical protein
LALSSPDNNTINLDRNLVRGSRDLASVEACHYFCARTNSDSLPAPAGSLEEGCRLRAKDNTEQVQQDFAQ